MQNDLIPKDMSLLELNRAVIRRQAGGKTIWQPRIGCWLDDRAHDGRSLGEGYEGLSDIGLYEKLGCSDRMYVFNRCIQIHYDPSVRVTEKQTGPLTREIRMDTPVGSVWSVVKGNESNYGVMPAKWLAETEEDLKVLCYIEAGMTYGFDQREYDQLYAERAHLGLPTIYLPRTSIQKLYLDVMGVEETVFALADYPDTVREYCRVLTENQRKLLEVVCRSPFEWVNFGDNLHCGTLPPALFEEYVLPVYQERNEVLHRAGIFTTSHWDGNCKTLLPYAKETGLSGIEAVTPEPQGDVTLAEVKEHLGDDVFLVDGIAAVLFSDYYPEEMLKAQVEEALHLFEGQLVLGISDELPSDGLLERVRLVGGMVDAFNAER